MEKELRLRRTAGGHSLSGVAGRPGGAAADVVSPDPALRLRHIGPSLCQPHRRRGRNGPATGGRLTAIIVWVAWGAFLRRRAAHSPAIGRNVQQRLSSPSPPLAAPAIGRAAGRERGGKSVETPVG